MWPAIQTASRDERVDVWQEGRCNLRSRLMKRGGNPGKAMYVSVLRILGPLLLARRQRVV
jgi:hypothetical protein